MNYSSDWNKEPIVSFATLINKKIVIPSSSTSYLAVDQHFFFELFANVLKNAYVDEIWYMERYPDIRDASERGVVLGARQHYVQFGFYEHRIPYKIDVDEAWYLEAYPDVKAAIGDRHYASGQEHFERAGYREGRLPHPNFALRTVNSMEGNP